MDEEENMIDREKESQPGIPGQTFLDTKRLLSLSDGVFSIVMTLLVLDMKFPEITRIHGSELTKEILLMLHRVEIYAATFLTLGAFWVVHHIHFHFIKRSDRPLIWINIGFLMVISLLPVSTMIIGDHPEHDIAALIFGGNLLISHLLLYFGWAYAAKNRRLIADNVDQAVVEKETKDLLYTGIAFVAAIPITLISQHLGLFCYLIIPIIQATIIKGLNTTGMASLAVAEK